MDNNIYWQRLKDERDRLECKVNKTKRDRKRIEQINEKINRYNRNNFLTELAAIARAVAAVGIAIFLGRRS